MEDVVSSAYDTNLGLPVHGARGINLSRNFTVWKDGLGDLAGLAGEYSLFNNQPSSLFSLLD